MRYFLDTNMIVYCLKGMFPEIKNHMRSVPSQSIVIPAVVRAEIEFGACKSNDYDGTIKKYRRLMDTFCSEAFDEDCAKTYGRIRAELESKGTLIGPNDLLIAATALSKDGVVVTHNVKEFSRVTGLRVEDWTEPVGK